MDTLKGLKRINNLKIIKIVKKKRNNKKWVKIRN